MLYWRRALSRCSIQIISGKIGRERFWAEVIKEHMRSIIQPVHAAEPSWIVVPEQKTTIEPYVYMVVLARFFVFRNKPQ